MTNRRRALLVCAIALVGAILLLLLRDRDAPVYSVKAAAVAQPWEAAPEPQTAATPKRAARSPPVASPVFDLVRVEKDEVCEGEENLITVHAHTTDGNDVFLHYTVAGEAGAQMPVRAYLGRDGKPAPQYAMAFSKDNVATRIELPSYRVKNCRPARMLIVTMRMLPNSVAEREFTATVRELDAVPFTPAWYEWAFGDGSFEVTAGPVAVRDYSGLPQRTAFSDLLVTVKALDGGGQSVEGRFPLHIRNIAFDTRRRGIATLFTEPAPRFPAIGADGVVRQKFRIWHAEDVPVQITGATMSRLFLPEAPGAAPARPETVAADHTRLLRHTEVPPRTAREEEFEVDFGAAPTVYAITFELQGITATGMNARGQLTILRPAPRPTRENSVPIQDPAMILKIRRAMAILKQETVSQEDLWRLEREGKLQ
jgi:hypothetical protein